MTLTKPVSVVARICLAIGLASLAACAGVNDDDVDVEDETGESSESALSEKKQPKLELKLQDAWTKSYEAPPSAICASRNLFAFVELRGEALNRTIVDVMFTRLDSGGKKSIAYFELPKEGLAGDLPHIPPPIAVNLDGLGLDGSGFMVQVVQRRYGSGKIVGLSKSVTVRISPPKVELLSVVDASCPMGTCSAATLRVRPSSPALSPSSYACSDFELGLRYGSESDPSFQTMLKRQLTPGIVRGNQVVVLMSTPFPPRLATDSAVVLQASQVVSNTLDLP